MKVAIIGGGAGGMMSAVWSAYNGAEVTLYESNDKLGKKIYITGKGRCNVTNNCDNSTFLSNVVTNSKFMIGAIAKWSSSDTISFLEQWGLDIKTERGNRVFPLSNKASDVTKTFEKAMTSLGVKKVLSSKIKCIECKKNTVLLHTMTDIVEYDGVIIATGGMSYSSTGSTGDGYKFAKGIGHSIVPPRAALCEIYLKEDVSALNGVSLKNVRLSAYYQGKEIASQLGEMIFTYRGISGPIALTMSSYINRLPLDKVQLVLDLKTGLPYKANTNGTLTIESRLQKDLLEMNNKAVRNCLVHMLPASVASYVLDRTKLNLDSKVNSLTVANRTPSVDGVKHLTFGVSKLAGLDGAIITSGGVSTKEISPSTMQSKLQPRVFFAGECIDIDALTGGFNLQVAFSTGYVAGSSIMQELYELEEQ